MRRIIFFTCLFLIPGIGVAAPTINQVQTAALQYAGLDGTQVEKWQSRASWKAALPQLRVSVQRSLDQQLRITTKDNVSISGGTVTIGPNEQDLLQDYNADTRIQVTAVWYLDRLVFDRDEILVSQERRRRNEEKFNLLDRVNQSYYERRSALELLNQHKRLPVKDRIKLKRIIHEHTARLNAYTGGWFSTVLKGA